MTEYIYFVKCPNRLDEHFDTFNDAKACAMGCLTLRPVITQVEVDRNDFGECTGSSDLGTVWSWEDTMTDVPADSSMPVYSKAETVDCDDDYFNCEFDELDAVPDNYRRPVPAGMSIESLVEEMEENEDTVECKVCEELHDKTECHKDEKLGWVCESCSSKQLKESATTTWTCFFDDREVGTVEAATEYDAKVKMMDKYPEYHYGLYDGCFWVEPLTEAVATDIYPKELNRYVTLTYSDMTVPIVTRVIPATREDPEDYEEEYRTDVFEYEVFLDDVATVIYENFMTEEDAAQVPGGMEALEDNDAWLEFLKSNFDKLFEKYYKELLDFYEEEAEEAAREQWQQDFDDYEPDPDRAYDEWRDRQLFGERLEESDDEFYDRLTFCPECGSERSFDRKAGCCLECKTRI